MKLYRNGNYVDTFKSYSAIVHWLEIHVGSAVWSGKSILCNGDTFTVKRK